MIQVPISSLHCSSVYISKMLVFLIYLQNCYFQLYSVYCFDIVI